MTITTIAQTGNLPPPDESLNPMEYADRCPVEKVTFPSAYVQSIVSATSPFFMQKTLRPSDDFPSGRRFPLAHGRVNVLSIFSLFIVRSVTNRDPERPRMPVPAVPNTNKYAFRIGRDARG